MLQNSLFDIITPAKTPASKSASARKDGVSGNSPETKPEAFAGNARAKFKPMLVNERELQTRREAESAPPAQSEKSSPKQGDKKAKFDQAAAQPQTIRHKKSDQKRGDAPSAGDKIQADHAKRVESDGSKAGAPEEENARTADTPQSEEGSIPSLTIAQAYVEATKPESCPIKCDQIAPAGDGFLNPEAEGGQAEHLEMAGMGEVSVGEISLEELGVSSLADASFANASSGGEAQVLQAAAGSENSAFANPQAVLGLLTQNGETIEVRAEDAHLETIAPLQVGEEKDVFPVLAQAQNLKSAAKAQALEQPAFSLEAGDQTTQNAQSIDLETNLTTMRESPRAATSVPQIDGRQPSPDSIGAESFTDIANTPYGMRGLADLARALEGNALEKASGLAAQPHGGQAMRPTPLQMLPIEIGMQAMRGANSFQIRLDPAELGRVDVKLEVNHDGEVNAHLIVERPETLQMLRRDATTLQYAFEQAGLKSSQDGLNFSLKGEGQNSQNQSQNGTSQNAPQEEDAALQAQIEQLSLRRLMIPHSSIDRMV